MSHLKENFIHNKVTVATEFTCQRCGKPKKSKTIILWNDNNQTKTICNGCYGELLSK